jgi:hypothetical protein
MKNAKRTILKKAWMEISSLKNLENHGNMMDAINIINIGLLKITGQWNIGLKKIQYFKNGGQQDKWIEKCFRQRMFSHEESAFIRRFLISYLPQRFNHCAMYIKLYAEIEAEYEKSIA